MTDYLDKLNLRPGERRLVIAVIITVFVVLNIWFVWPQFKEWKKVQDEFAKAKDTLVKYRLKISQRNKFEAERVKLEDEGAAVVVPEEMALQLRKNVQTQASQSGVQQNGMSDLPRQSRSESYFDEASINMKFIGTGEQELVDFLYNISAGRSMIRVKDLSVSPDQQLQKLQGDITLTASYQKKAPPKIVPPGTTAPKSAPTTTKTNAAAAKPSSPPPAKKPLPQSADVER